MEANLLGLIEKWKNNNKIDEQEFKYERMLNFLYEKQIINNLPKKYHDIDLINIPQEIKDFVSRKDKNTKLFLHGPVGTGKTCLARGVQVLMDVVKRKLDLEKSSFINVPELLLESASLDLKTFYQTRGKRKVIVLDDLSVEKQSEWNIHRLYVLINGIYENDHFLVVTSNLNPQQLAERVGDRIASRLLENTTVVKIDGKDKRIS